MSDINIAIIEDNVELCNYLKHHLESQENLKVVGMAHDGEKGISLLKGANVDVALIDIILPIIDGVAILERLQEFKFTKTPIYIMLTALNNDSLTRKALSLGADYFILKPFDIDVLKLRITELYEFKNSEISMKYKSGPMYRSIDEMVSNLLHKVGIASSLNGYVYLKTAISLAYEDRSMLEGITKILYPAVAKKCGASTVRVERSIRHAIESSWEKGNQQAYKEHLCYFSHTNVKPTNSNFICLAIELYEQCTKK